MSAFRVSQPKVLVEIHEEQVVLHYLTRLPHTRLHQTAFLGSWKNLPAIFPSTSLYVLAFVLFRLCHEHVEVVLLNEVSTKSIHHLTLTHLLSST
jgi:hypothetical protein